MTTLKESPAREAAFGLSAALNQVAQRVTAGVVEVHTAGHGSGAGTIWSADGTIVTNHHVAPGDRAEIALADGRRFSGVAVARDRDNDLAVLQIEARGLPAVPIGDARTLKAGDLVFAVGHPFGVRQTLTAGIVSAALPARATAEGRELVRANVMLAPGNSGGPLADAQGRVVGINAMVSGGLALAVPSHLVDRLAGVQRAPRTLGVQARTIPLPAAFAAAAGVGADHGVLVSAVIENSPAERAGLMTGDVLAGLDGAAVRSVAGLSSALAAAGEVASLRLLRGGVPLDVPVRFTEQEQRRAA